MTVKSGNVATVNRSEILSLLVAAPAHGILVADLVRHFGGTPSARASLSRTLRRMWRRGLVELHANYETMSGKRREAQARATEAAAEPKESYMEALRLWFNFIERSDPWGSPEAYVAEQRAMALETPRLRAVRVTRLPPSIGAEMEGP